MFRFVMCLYAKNHPVDPSNADQSEFRGKSKCCLNYLHVYTTWRIFPTYENWWTVETALAGIDHTVCMQ